MALGRANCWGEVPRGVAPLVAAVEQVAMLEVPAAVLVPIINSSSIIIAVVTKSKSPVYWESIAMRKLPSVWCCECWLTLRSDWTAMADSVSVRVDSSTSLSQSPYKRCGPPCKPCTKYHPRRGSTTSSREAPRTNGYPTMRAKSIRIGPASMSGTRWTQSKAVGRHLRTRSEISQRSARKRNVSYAQSSKES